MEAEYYSKTLTCVRPFVKFTSNPLDRKLLKQQDTCAYEEGEQDANQQGDFRSDHPGRGAMINERIEGDPIRRRPAHEGNISTPEHIVSRSM